ncbi:MAG: lipopolysaccharide heptosyltransferase II [Phycisphaeraceae bacterium]|nr:lipopolysaccharide heptosyltransferase II [Phycisphaeraceae bacterium]MCW5761617.1 lipopolysaccharide heptosyltransferase II [Phycisphaeraceae bacterium]
MHERVLIVMPSWVGDLIMATPALRLIRDALPDSHLTAMLRPGLDELLVGTALVQDYLIADARGLFGPWHVARTLKNHRFDTALILPNSFSTAFTVALAGIPRRIGYARDHRSLLLTERIQAPRTPNHWAIIPAVQYYIHLARIMLGQTLTLTPPLLTSLTHAPLDLPPHTLLELAPTPDQHAAATTLLAHAGISTRYAILNPGGNNPAKRWPPERFAALADHLARSHHLAILINGSPAERDLAHAIARSTTTPCTILPDLGISLGSLKALVARAAIMITNDTGPRHIAAALRVPLVTLFGPTDPRWTTIPTHPDAPEIILIANKDLTPEQSANDFPHTSRIDRITLDEVIAAVDQLL